MLVFLGNGSGTLSSPVTYHIANGPQNVLLADFNNDGNLDAVTIAAANLLGVSLGNGDGTFDAQQNTVINVLPNSISIGDINNDGNIDVIGVTAASNDITVLLGNGDGTFQTALTYAVGTNPRDLTVGDFNGDGYDDVANTNLSNSTVSILLGNSDGTLTQGQIFSVNAGTINITSGDFNSNGVIDIATSDSNGISIFTAETTSGVSPLLNFSLLSTNSSLQALNQFETKSDQLKEQQAEISTHISRITIAENHLSNTNENLLSAESKIRDADYAEDTAKLIRLKILQNIQVAVLAQANLQPSLVLELLS